jgi:hypothetical protein
MCVSFFHIAHRVHVHVRVVVVCLLLLLLLLCSSVRLLEEEVSFVSASSIFEQECVARGTSMDLLVPLFAQRLHRLQTQAAASGGAAGDAAIRMTAFKDTCREEVGWECPAWFGCEHLDGSCMLPS